MAGDLTAKVGHQSAKQARDVGAAFLARADDPTLHCDTGLCYTGRNNLFPCRCAPMLDRLPA